MKKYFAPLFVVLLTNAPSSYAAALFAEKPIPVDNQTLYVQANDFLTTVKGLYKAHVASQSDFIKKNTLIQDKTTKIGGTEDFGNLALTLTGEAAGSSEVGYHFTIVENELSNLSTHIEALERDLQTIVPSPELSFWDSLFALCLGGNRKKSQPGFATAFSKIQTDLRNFVSAENKGLSTQIPQPNPTHSRSNPYFISYTNGINSGTITLCGDPLSLKTTRMKLTNYINSAKIV